MESKEFDTIKKVSLILKIGLTCDVSSDEMSSLQKLNAIDGVMFEIAKDQHTYDVIIGKGKIVAATIYKMNLEQLSVAKIIEVCTTISQSNVWTVVVMQTVKPNAWYEKAVGRSMFVYRDSNDFITETMSGKKVWELDVKNSESKYSHAVELVKKIDLTSTDALLDVVSTMANLGKFTMSFAIMLKSNEAGESDNTQFIKNTQFWYTKDLKVAWSIAELLRSSYGCEISVIDLIDDADPAALNLSSQNSVIEINGLYVYNGDISMRMLINYETENFKGDIQIKLTSCTLGKQDDFSYFAHSISKSEENMNKRFYDLVELAKQHPKLILNNCWLEALN